MSEPTWLWWQISCTYGGRNNDCAIDTCRLRSTVLDVDCICLAPTLFSPLLGAWTCPSGRWACDTCHTPPTRPTRAWSLRKIGYLFPSLSLLLLSHLRLLICKSAGRNCIACLYLLSHLRRLQEALSVCLFDVVALLKNSFFRWMCNF